MKFTLLLFLSICSFTLLAQAPPLSFSGYLETYYAYDFGQPSDHNRPDFLYSHNRHNEVNLNLGFLKAAYFNDRVRSNLALMAGTYPNANLSAESGVLKNVFEANAGVKISKNKDLWIDAGIFTSHIGFESAIGKDCWNLSRSLSAENSPYYETGAKIGYTTDNGKWFISGLLLNGWQRIQRMDGNNTPAFGHQLTYKPNEKVTLNSSSFIGNDKPDTLRQMRYFHDLYGIFQLSPKVSITTGFDIGMEQKAKGSSDYHTWYSPVLITSLSMSEKVKLALRVEYFSDAMGVLVDTGTPHGFQIWGASINVDYQIMDNLLWRIEARGLQSKDEIFVNNGAASKQNGCLATALAVSF